MLVVVVLQLPRKLQNKKLLKNDEYTHTISYQFNYLRINFRIFAYVFLGFPVSKVHKSFMEM